MGTPDNVYVEYELVGAKGVSLFQTKDLNRRMERFFLSNKGILYLNLHQDIFVADDGVCGGHIETVSYEKRGILYTGELLLKAYFEDVAVLLKLVDGKVESYKIVNKKTGKEEQCGQTERVIEET